MKCRPTNHLTILTLLTILLQSHICLRSVLLLSYHSLTLLFQTSSLCQRWASILEQSCYCLSTLFLLSCNNLMSVLEVSYYYLITALLCSSTLPHSLPTILLQSHCSSPLLLCLRGKVSSLNNLVNVLVLSSYYLVTISCLSWKCLITISFLS